MNDPTIAGQQDLPLRCDSERTTRPISEEAMLFIIDMAEQCEKRASRAAEFAGRGDFGTASLWRIAALESSKHVFGLLRAIS